MIKFNHDDFEVETEIEEGNDGFTYGNYVDWDRFRVENEDELLNNFGISLPWEQELTILEYADFINQEVFVRNPSILDSWDLNKLPILTKGSHTSNTTIQFLNRDDSNSDSIISDIFDYYGVPSGTEYEKELPESLQYWHNVLKEEYLENQYEIYKNYPIEFMNYENTIRDIQTKVNDTSDELTKKALILSSLIISESLFKSIIVQKIPKEIGISDFNQKLLSAEIDKKLRSHGDRKKLFKQLFGKKVPDQDWINLRNSLAHDIETATISNDSIIYTNLRTGMETSYPINVLFEKQIDFYKELQHIIDEDNITVK